MGLFSSSASLTRYLVQGKLADPFMETVQKGLSQNTIEEIDGSSEEKSIGWTSFERPYAPDFSGSPIIGSYLMFCLRMDKKSVPPKAVKKQAQAAMERRLADTGREYLSREEKKEIREMVHDALAVRVPAVPNIIDVLWNTDNGHLWLFSTQKAAKEEFEALFYKSFGVVALAVFPYTMAELMSELTDDQREALEELAPISFTG